MAQLYGPPSDGSVIPHELEDAIAADASSPASPIGASMNSWGRVPAVVHDEFSGLPDGPLAGRKPLLGPAWKTTGNTPVYLEAGEATSSGTGYAYLATTEKPETVWADVRFTVGTSVDDRPFCIAFCETDDEQMLNNFAAHAQIGPRGFTLEVRKDGEEPFPRLMQGDWFRTVPAGEYARIGVIVRGSTATVVGPYGEIFAATDPRVAEKHGNTVFWEPRAVNGSQAYVRNVTATTRAPEGPANGSATLGDLAMAGALVEGGGRTTGSRETHAQVAIGSDPVGSQPGVTFGAATIRAVLSTDAAVGATSIQTDRIIPAGSTLQLDSGADGETVVSGAYSSGSSAPYTTPLASPTTKAHATGIVVAATVDPKYRKSMYLHQGNGYFYFPDVAVNVIPGGSLYIGGLDVRIMRHTANVAGTHFGQGWRTGTFATASRPSAVSFGKGTQIFDTDLNKPLWSNGTAWVDAAGTAV